MAFEKKSIQLFFRDTHFRNLKFGYEIWVSIDFFCSKRLMQSKKPVKKSLYIEYEENRY